MFAKFQLGRRAGKHPSSAPTGYSFQVCFPASDQTKLSKPLLLSVTHHRSDLCLVPRVNGEGKCFIFYLHYQHLLPEINEFSLWCISVVTQNKQIQACFLDLMKSCECSRLRGYKYLGTARILPCWDHMVAVTLRNVEQAQSVCICMLYLFELEFINCTCVVSPCLQRTVCVLLDMESPAGSQCDCVVLLQFVILCV